MTKQQINIEALLVLAYRDKQIDRWRKNGAVRLGPAQEGSPSETMRRIGELGTMVQTSGPVERPITTVITEEYADLLTVHDAVLRLEDYYAEFQTESRIRLWTPDAAIEAGGSITATGTGGHREFQLVLPNRKPRSLRPISALALVIMHARGASRPFCLSKWSPRRGRKTMAGIIVARVVAGARASYQVWLMSLERLANELNGVLEIYDAEGPQADSEPWQIEDIAA